MFPGGSRGLAVRTFCHIRNLNGGRQIRRRCNPGLQLAVDKIGLLQGDRIEVPWTCSSFQGTARDREQRFQPGIGFGLVTGFSGLDSGVVLRRPR